MHQSSSTLLHMYEEDPTSAGACVAPVAIPMHSFAGSPGTESSVVDAEEATERLADLSDHAKRLNRPQQADRFLLLAWLAFDSSITASPA